MEPPAPCRTADVTLSDNARRLCERLGVPEQSIKTARAGSTATHGAPQWLICWGELPTPDGRRVRMACSHAIPCHVVTWRPIPRD